jgi:hypothetical protein
MFSTYCPSCKNINKTPEPTIVKLLHIFKSDIKPYYCNELKCNTLITEKIRKKLEKNIYKYENGRDFMFSKCYVLTDKIIYYHPYSVHNQLGPYKNPVSFLDHAIKKSHYLIKLKNYPKNAFRQSIALYMNTVLDEINYYNILEQPIYYIAIRFRQFHIARWIETNIQQVRDCIQSLNTCDDINGIILRYI